MRKSETNLRKAAEAFDTALTEAAADGLAVTWPRRREDLASLVISETAKAAPPAAPEKVA